MTDQGTAEARMSKRELLERIQQSYAALEVTLHPLSEDQLLRPGPSGWAVKDHLAHLAVWELGVAELLKRRPRFAAMQVVEAVSQGRSEDEINDLIYRRNAGLSPAQASEFFQSSHQQMLQALEPLSDDDLYKPYAAYVPEGDQARQDPVMNWIIGNTFAHFDDHNRWIRDLLASDPHAR
jgi:hypothetical protein